MPEAAFATGTFTINPTVVGIETTFVTGILTLNRVTVSSGQTAATSGQFILNRAAQSASVAGGFTLNPSTASVVIGPNITAEAGERITLTPQTETVAPGSTVVSREWRLNGQLIGTTKTVLVGAPISRNGQTDTYTYTVTDSNGNTSTPSSINITGKPAPLRTGGGKPLVKRTGPGTPAPQGLL